MTTAPRPMLALAPGLRDHAQGPHDAPITLVEYGDYQCPDCSRADGFIKEVQRRMGERLRFIFRNFPLIESHAHAQHAAEAAECAANDGRFWEMHDLLFERQGMLDDASLVSYAKAIGLDATRFGHALRTHAHAPRVHEDLQSGEASGVNGTPTFFINGVLYDDEAELETFIKALNAAAAPAKKPSGRRSPRV